jgi:hypothetical protein
MTKLTDTQCVLLSTAAKRENLSIYPLPTSLKPGGGLHKALAALTTRGLIEERETRDTTAVSRLDGDYRYALFVTPAGLAAIGVECDGEPSTDKPNAADPPKVERITKTSAVLDLLRRSEGATLAELIAATGWLPHTTRAALTGLKKKAHVIERGKRGEVTCYFLRAA